MGQSIVGGFSTVVVRVTFTASSFLLAISYVYYAVSMLMCNNWTGYNWKVDRASLHGECCTEILEESTTLADLGRFITFSG